jgi:hypothetical protein
VRSGYLEIPVLRAPLQVRLCSTRATAKSRTAEALVRSPHEMLRTPRHEKKIRERGRIAEEGHDELHDMEAGPRSEPRSSGAAAKSWRRERTRRVAAGARLMHAQNEITSNVSLD